MKIFAKETVHQVLIFFPLFAPFPPPPLPPPPPPPPIFSFCALTNLCLSTFDIFLILFFSFSSLRFLMAALLRSSFWAAFLLASLAASCDGVSEGAC